MRNLVKNGDFNNCVANTTMPELIELRSEIFMPPLSSSDQWQHITGMVQAPKNAANLSLELVAKDQPSEKKQIWFDDVEVYPIDVN